MARIALAAFAALALAAPVVAQEKAAVLYEAEGCGYVVEGHVPAKVIDTLLAEKPRIRGISLPGMPEGSPGMGGVKTEAFTIYELGTPKVFAVE